MAWETCGFLGAVMIDCGIAYMASIRAMGVHRNEKHKFQPNFIRGDGRALRDYCYFTKIYSWYGMVWYLELN
jgi:hypothetical protein